MAPLPMLQIIGLILFAIISLCMFAIQQDRFDDYRWHIFAASIAAFAGLALVGWYSYSPRVLTPYVDVADEKKSGSGGGGRSGRSGGNDGNKKGGKSSGSGGAPAAAKSGSGSGGGGSGGGGGESGSDGGGKNPGSTFSDCVGCPVMVVIPPGENMIGSARDDSNANPNEVPRTRLTINQKFAVSRYEIKVSEFTAFAETTGFSSSGACNTDGVGGANADFRNPGLSQDSGHPVICVNVADAQSYVKWLSEKTQKPYRLMSEGRWEYVRRGAMTSGDGNASPETGNLRGEQWLAATTTAGRYSSNSFFVFDMTGNAAEWTADCWQADHTNRPTNGSAVRSGDCSARAVRGGSWDDRPKDGRAASRRKIPADTRDWRIGFRVMRALADTTRTSGAAE